MRQLGILLASSVVGGSFLVTSCGGGGEPTNPGGAAVATVTVTPPTASLTPQQTVQLTAVLRDAGGSSLSGRSVAWTSSHNDRASVSSNGLVTALAAGNVTITATSEGKSGTASVMVTAPVATVEVTTTTTSLVPQQTLQLGAVLKDATGGTLAGRQVTWTSSATQVATINGQGLVTALATGSTTITAMSEGQSGTVQLTVESGAIVGASGGIVTGGNGNIEITIPPGALTTSTPISVTAVGAAPGAPPANWQFAGPAYRIGPPGIAFTQPVTVKMKFEPAALPRWAMGGDLAVLGNGSGQWGALTDVAVDVSAGTVSGRTSTTGASLRLNGGRGGGRGGAWTPGADIAHTHDGGADHAVAVLDPSVGLTPNHGSVNTQQRSVQFRALVLPRGVGISMPAPTPTPTPQWKYRWRTTGQNGTLGSSGNIGNWTDDADEQYIATSPVLNQLSGEIDIVYVDILLNPEAANNPSAQRIVTVQASIDADLQTTYEISPANKTIGPSETAAFQFLIRDRDGNILQPQQGAEFTWDGTENHGTRSGGGLHQPTKDYTSKATFNFPPPRVDEIKATMVGVTIVTHRQPVWDLSQIPPRMIMQVTGEEHRELKGEARAFVTVKVNYQVKLQPVSNNVSVGGTKQLQVTLEPAYDGPGIEYVYTNTAAHGTLDVANNARTSAKQVTYTAKNFDNGGTDQIQVEAVSVVGGTVLESLGMGNASVDVDPWRNGSIGPDQRINEFGNWFTSAQIRVAKVQGATSYEVKSQTPDGLYTKTFSGATSTNVYSVNEVLDGGTHWLINIEAGFNTIEVAADARWNTYFNKYKNTVVQYKATQ